MKWTRPCADNFSPCTRVFSLVVKQKNSRPGILYVVFS
jgi:hypothetical protein